jgi:hypothetical protein
MGKNFGKKYLPLLLFCALLIFNRLKPLSLLTSCICVGCPRIFIDNFLFLVGDVRQEKA